MEPSVAEDGEKAQLSVLFVCMGNICRSPLAEGIFRHGLSDAGLAGLVSTDSAGTGNWRACDPPDPRSVEVAASHGIDISGQSARQVGQDDFDRFDLIFAMDRSNAAALRALAPSARHDRIFLFLDDTQGNHADILDPYFGGADGFEDVFQLLRQGCGALLARLGADLRQPSG